MSGLPPFALSVRQPWAWAIIHAGKDIENRSHAAIRHMRHRASGPVCIHAAKGMTQDEYWSARQFMQEVGVACPQPAALIRGAIIGIATIVETVRDHRSPWFMGPAGLVLDSVAPVDPIAAVGQLGLFEWSPSGAAIEPAKPWMFDEPSKSGRRRRASEAAGNLFDAQPRDTEA